MRTIIALLLTVGVSCAADIIPVAKFPNPVTMPDGKTWYNPTVKQCVEAGYRILAPMPATPEGQQVKSTAIVQDDKDQTRCKYAVVYEAIPKPPDPPVYVPEVLTNLPPEKVLFQFTTNGFFRGVIRACDATNKAAVK